MTNAITINATAQTRINGIGSALRCVAVVGREVRARHARRADLLCASSLPKLDLTGKRLDAAHASSSDHVGGQQRPPVPTQQPAFASLPASDASRSWRRMPATMPAADQYLPPAAWASLVIQRAISA